MPEDLRPDELYETVRSATRQGVRDALWDVVTVFIALVLVALGIPLVFASAGGGGPVAWLGALVGLVIVGMGLYRLYDRFWRRR